MKVFLLALFSSIVVGSLATEVDDKELTPEQQFDMFRHKYGKSYKDKDEYNYRFKVFKNNLKVIEELQTNNRGTAVYGVTQFADLTSEEFMSMCAGSTEDEDVSDAMPLEIDTTGNFPDNFDWREKKVVNEVKNQKHCGSCWAFAAVGSIESLWAIKHKKLYTLSVQELVDCDNKSAGCHGGKSIAAFKTLVKLGGLETEESYPYEQQQLKCRFNESKVVAKISGFRVLPRNEMVMAEWLFKHGPFVVSLNCSDMNHYSGGISHPNRTSCSHKHNHVVVAVGYGVEKGVPFWILRNSWGKHFGEKGYYRLYRGENVCGIANLPSTAVL